MTLPEIQTKISNARELDFGTIFNQSIELFKKSWLQGFLMQLFVIIIMLPVILVMYIPFIMMVISQSENGEVDPNVFSEFLAGFSVIYLFVFFVVIILLSSISVTLQAGLFRVLRDLDANRQVKTADLFYFFKGKYFGKMILLMLVSMLIAIPAALLCYVPLIYAMVPLSFFVIFFAFNPDLSIGDIVSASFKLGTKKWLIGFGLLFVSTLLASILGFLMCGIGTLVTAPFVYHPFYFIYKEVIGFDNESEVSQIGKILD
ncbi:MAG: hypothetical protein R2797_04515 [Gelidibacter sp.]